MSRLASSPHSSDQANSRNGSPETKLTAFSPEAPHLRQILEQAKADAAARRRLAAPDDHAQDPFTAPASARSSGRAQLSPTASSFTPGSLGDRAGISDADIHAMQRHVQYSLDVFNNSQAEEKIPASAFAPRHPVDFGPIGGARVPPPVSTTHYVSPPYNMYCQYGAFDSVNRNRAFVIEGIPRDMPYDTIAAVFNRRSFLTVLGPVMSELASHGRVYVGFADIVEASEAAQRARDSYPRWRIYSITAKEFMSKFEPQLVSSTSDWEGHVTATVYYQGNDPAMNGAYISHLFEATVSGCGSLTAFKTIPTEHDNVVSFHLEFKDASLAEKAVAELNGPSMPQCVVEINHFKPDVPVYSHAHHTTQEFIPRLSPVLVNSRPLARRDSFVSSSPYMELSPTGRSTIPVGDPAVATWNRRTDESHNYRSALSGRNRHNSSANSSSLNQNHVDIERIRLGLDVRTTIMLRNIPNKLNQAMLKEIVDHTSFGKYDFMYLRIDFANDCKLVKSLYLVPAYSLYWFPTKYTYRSVGYAFINFEDPIDIIDFAKARAGHSWNCFNSDKVAEISYATIQGKDCLVQKFRNSSVMLEHPAYRPKIFHTGTGPLAGTEEQFPGPDNPSKMRRSVENAEHVGLFAPRVGQQYRDEQRRRRSQFDRGTTAAEREWVCKSPAHPERMDQIHSNIMDSWYDFARGNNHRHHHSG